MMKTQTTTVYYWTHQELTLNDAIKAVISGPVSSTEAGISVPPPLLANAVGLFHAPRKCCFGLLRGGDFRDESDKPLDMTTVFEARVFAPEGELRWLNDPERFGIGKAVYISETDGGPKNWLPAEPMTVDAFENAYLLWGEHWKPAREFKNGWSCLAAGRIGELPAPFPGANSRAPALRAKERVRLRTREYFGPASAEAGAHGNIVVVDERLLCLERYVQSEEEASNE
jgi:CRISPR-associated protein (TIGR03984 family)